MKLKFYNYKTTVLTVFLLIGTLIFQPKVLNAQNCATVLNAGGIQEICAGSAINLIAEVNADPNNYKYTWTGTISGLLKMGIGLPFSFLTYNPTVSEKIIIMITKAGCPTLTDTVKVIVRQGAMFNKVIVIDNFNEPGIPENVKVASPAMGGPLFATKTMNGTGGGGIVGNVRTMSIWYVFGTLTSRADILQEVDPISPYFNEWFYSSSNDEGNESNTELVWQGVGVNNLNWKGICECLDVNGNPSPTASIRLNNYFADQSGVKMTITLLDNVGRKATITRNMPGSNFNDYDEEFALADFSVDPGFNWCEIDKISLFMDTNFISVDYKFDEVTFCCLKTPKLNDTNIKMCLGNCLKLDTLLNCPVPSQFIPASKIDWKDPNGNPLAYNALVCPPSGLNKYTVKLTDELGCMSTLIDTFKVCDTPKVSLVNETICLGSSVKLSPTISGGNTPYTFTWSPATGLSCTNCQNPIASPSTTTIYTLVIGTTETGDNGIVSCPSSATVKVTVNNIPSSKINGPKVLCAGVSTTQICAEAVGAGISYLWSPGNETSQCIQVPAGTYTVTVHDGNGCSSSSSITIISVPTPSLVVTADNNIVCEGAKVTLTATASGGTPAYSYTWNTGQTGSPIMVTATVTKTYTVTVSDDNNCTASKPITINVVPNTISITIKSIDDICGKKIGKLETIVSGGMAPYTYKWSTGESTSLITGLGAGTYTVTVTDDAGCSKSATATIVNTAGPNVIITGGTGICIGTCIDLSTTVTGGVIPYRYLWNTGSTNPSTNVCPSTTTTYTVTVTDDNNCTASNTTQVIVNPKPEISITPSNPEICKDKSVELSTIVSGGTPNYTYSWSPSTGLSSTTVANPIATPTTTTTYTVILTDQNGCKDTASVKVIVLDNPVLSLQSKIDDKCNQKVGSISVSVSGGIPQYTYIWNTIPAQTNATATGLGAGTYTVTVTDSKGCSASLSQSIISLDGPTVSIKGPNPNCIGDTVTLTAIPSPNSPSNYSYQWSNGLGTNQLATINKVISTTTYTVTITDKQTNCTAVSDYTVTVNTCSIITHRKVFEKVKQTGLNTYDVYFQIIVDNIGTGKGVYNLLDSTAFDPDVEVLSMQFTSDAVGHPASMGPINFSMPSATGYILSTNQMIADDKLDYYNLVFKVKLNLNNIPQGGNGQYDPCLFTNNEYTPKHGLYNLSFLDTPNDLNDERKVACGDLPYIIHEKLIDNVVSTGINKYKITYKIVVKNIGGATGSYNLSDAPGFDDDIDILSASYSSNAPGFTGPTNLVGNGPWTLSTAVNLGAGGTHTYNLFADVKIDLIDGISGDDKYFACNKSSTKFYTKGEGLFNESRLDLDNDGNADIRDTVCADLPFIIHDKTLGSVTPVGVNTYDVVYGIQVKNIGGAAGQYDLLDEPKFDDDIAQVAAKYLSSVTGVTTNLAVPGPWLIANNQSINAGGIHNYTLTVRVKLDLEDGVTGDDEYTACESGTPGVPKENEGLFNRSLLDVNDDGKYDYRDSVCTDIPYIVHEKLIDNVVSTGINKYKITYKIVVKNIGGVTGSYNLSDAPGFDDDITITGAQYSTNASGNTGNPGPAPLATSGLWTLATNQNINANATQTYTIPVDVTVSFEAGSGGDNILKSCGQTVPGVPQVGEGLFNRSLLDLDKNGTPDRQDSVCYDLPYILHEKTFISTTQTGARTFKTNYKIVVRNIGTAAGTYGLADAPKFDDDVDIISASYTSNAPGFTGPTSLSGNGPWTLSTNVNIPANGTHTYNLAIDERFDLSTSTGDKTYDKCGKTNPNILTAGEGLFNESRLDLDNDGKADMRDTVCSDLPYVEHEKFFTSVTKTGLGLYTVKYKVEVKNRGGAIGDYDLGDNPGLDDDFEILNAKLSSDASGNSATPGPIAIPNSGPWILANDQKINPGVKQTYNIELDLRIDLQNTSSAGDEIYNYCGTKNPNTPSKGEGLFNETTLDVDNNGVPDQRDSVCRDVEIVDLALRKKVVTPAPYAYGQDITFSIEVINQGNVTMNQVEVIDYIPKGYTLSPANVGWTGVYPTVKKLIAGPLKPGTSLTTNIVLRLAQTQGGRMDWINYSEITKYINSRNEDVTLEDEDSKPGSDGTLERAVKPNDPKDDDIFSRDKGGEEDDHDPAGIEVFDLALRKTTSSVGPFKYGSIVPFTIKVYNQGSVKATDVSIVDYIPNGFTFGSNNSIWTLTSNMASTTVVEINPGDSATLVINLLVNQGAGDLNKSWYNEAEIKVAKDDKGIIQTMDIDSRFNMNPDDDNDVECKGLDDNEINEDGKNHIDQDEDDNDPECIEIVDLALRKWVLNKKPFYILGDIIPFTITVFNQGNVTMSSVTINDYLYPGFAFDGAINSGWNQSGTTLTKTQLVVLAPGDSVQIPLNLKVQLAPGNTLQNWWNYSEIKSIVDSKNVNRDNDDADSKSNSDTPYERSVKPGDPFDNVITGKGQPVNEDEDDHDPENVIVKSFLGDNVWKDKNGNGLKEFGEPGVQGVHVYLYDCVSKNILQKDTTDLSGAYGFDGLESGSYYVRFDATPINMPNCDWTFPNKGINDNIDSDVDTLGFTTCTFLEWGERDSTHDAGLVELATYGDYVWHDRDADGMQQSGEEGVSGVKVILFDAATNLPVRTTFTNSNGLYLFEKLLPTNYYAKFTPPVGDGWIITDPNLGPDFKDSDVDNTNGPGTNATTYLSPGEDDRTWDLGIWKCAKIDGRVFYDSDFDGVFDSNENGINGLEVYLINANTGIVVSKVFTKVSPGTASNDGYYLFACVKPGTYYLRFERPGHLASSDPYKGSNRDLDSDISHENGINTTRSFTLRSEDMVLNIGGGFQDKSIVGDYVWFDANINGLQDNNEQPIEGVKVSAVKPDGKIVSQSTTKRDGHYMLDGIAHGDYYIKFEAPTSYGYTIAHTGNDAVDNDVDGTNGFGTTRTYRIIAGEERPSIDAGLIFQVLPLEWLSFDGRYNGSFTELDWKTGVELNNNHFEVERRHESEVSFTKIEDRKASAEANLKVHEYNHDDYNVSKSGIYYYRIKQVDRDGKSNYSKVISVKVDAGRELSLRIYPNPTDDYLNIEIGISEDSELEVRVFDETGKNLLTNPFGGFRKRGQYLDILDTKILAAGQYNLQIKTTSGIINKKFTLVK